MITYLAEEATLRPNLTLVIVASVLVGSGVYLILERALTRIVLGIILLGNGIALLYLVTVGAAKGSPLSGEREPSEMSDPLPMAMVLTAIVIALATVSFTLALAYRQWQLTGSDDIPDDLEDAAIQRLAERYEVSSTYEESAESTTEAEEDAVEEDEPELHDPDDPVAPAAVGGISADELPSATDPAHDGGERR